MLRSILFIIVMLFATSMHCWSTTYEGNISTTDSTMTLYATLPWTDGTTFSWKVDDETNPGYWSYFYNFSNTSNNTKELSHAILEVSQTFTAANIIRTTDYNGGGLGTYGPSDPSNPGIPGTIYGLKWNVPEVANGTDWDFFIVSDRAPMWGDFYGKDGKYKKNGVENMVYAYNKNFGTDTTAAIANGNAGGWALVPDTSGGGGGGGGGQVPEPGTFALLGSGLLALGLFGRKLRK